MANAQAVATSFKTELLNGLHAFSTSVVRGATTADTFKAALYTSGGTIGATTTAYSATGEVSGTGYTAGGISFTWVAPTNTGTTNYTTPSAALTYSTVTIGPTDCVLLYNSTQTNRAVASYTFTAQTVSAGNLVINMPTNAAGTAALNLT